MSTVSYNPKSADRAFLPKAGIYGPNQENDAECTLFSVGVTEPGSLDAPFEDKNCELEGGYTTWVVRVVYGGAVIFARSRAQANTAPNMGSKNLAWISNLGIEPTGTDPETGNPVYELDKLTNIPCIVKVAPPRPDRNDKTIFYTGSIVDIMAVPQ